MYFLLFRYHLPLEIGGILNLSKHKFPSPKNVMGQVNWPICYGEDLNFRKCILAMLLLIPLGNGRDPLFEQN